MIAEKLLKNLDDSKSIQRRKHDLKKNQFLKSTFVREIIYNFLFFFAGG